MTDDKALREEILEKTPYELMKIWEECEGEGRVCKEDYPYSCVGDSKQCGECEHIGEYHQFRDGKSICVAQGCVRKRFAEKIYSLALSRRAEEKCEVCGREGFDAHLCEKDVVDARIAELVAEVDRLNSAVIDVKCDEDFQKKQKESLLGQNRKLEAKLGRIGEMLDKLPSEINELYRTTKVKEFHVFSIRLEEKLEKIREVLK